MKIDVLHRWSLDGDLQYEKHRSRRINPMGKRFGCLAITILAIAQSTDLEFPTQWAEVVIVYLRTHVEGSIFALAASLLPYPKLAIRNGTRRAKVKHLLHQRVARI